MKTYFDHEKLDVYQEAIAFCGWVGDLLNEITAKAAAKDQLDRASTSLPLNIAEGNGKFSTVDRARKGSPHERDSCVKTKDCMQSSSSMSKSRSRKNAETHVA